MRQQDLVNHALFLLGKGMNTVSGIRLASSIGKLYGCRLQRSWTMRECIKYATPPLTVLDLAEIHPLTYPRILFCMAYVISWWRYQMETFSASLALCAGNSPVTGELPSQRPVTRSFGVFFDLRLNTRLSKHSRRWWFETPLWSLWRHCNVIVRRVLWHCVAV